MTAYGHKNTRPILLGLLKSKDEGTKELATDSLLSLYGQEIIETLTKMNDPVINRAIEEWKA